MPSSSSGGDVRSSPSPAPSGSSQRRRARRRATPVRCAPSASSRGGDDYPSSNYGFLATTRSLRGHPPGAASCLRPLSSDPERWASWPSAPARRGAKRRASTPTARVVLARGHEISTLWNGALVAEWLALIDKPCASPGRVRINASGDLGPFADARPRRGHRPGRRSIVSPRPP